MVLLSDESFDFLVRALTSNKDSVAIEFLLEWLLVEDSPENKAYEFVGTLKALSKKRYIDDILVILSGDLNRRYLGGYSRFGIDHTKDNIQDCCRFCDEDIKLMMDYINNHFSIAGKFGDERLRGLICDVLTFDAPKLQKAALFVSLLNGLRVKTVNNVRD